MSGSSQVADVPEIKLDNFAREYKNLIDSGKHGQLLVKCMSDYKYELDDNSTCFTVDKDGIVKNKDDVVVNGISITEEDGYNNKIKFSDIQKNRNFNSYNFDPTNFINDWKDLRTSLGDISLNEDGTFNMSGLTSDRLDKYHTKFDETIQDKHKEILKKRNNLDNKMRELYGEKGDADFNLDASVYSTMLFTIMTTSLLYYLFNKM